MIDPHVSVPMAKPASAAAAMAPEPLEEPQVQHPVFYGLRVAPLMEAEAKR